MKKIFNLNLMSGSPVAIRETNNAFNRLIKTVEPHSYSLDNYVETVSWFIEDLLEDMMFIGSNINYSKHNAEMMLAEVGILDFDGNYQIENTFEILKKSMSKFSREVKDIFAAKSRKHKQPIEVTQKILQKYHALGGKIYEVSEDELDNYENDSDEYHKYVVRTKNGTSDYRFYIIEHPIESQKDSNAVKACYTIDADEDYFETRPILYKNWLKLDDYHRYQTA